MSTVVKLGQRPRLDYRRPMPFGEYQTAFAEPRERTGHVKECCCDECLACACGAPLTYAGTSKCWDCHVKEKGLEGARKWSDRGTADFASRS